MDIAPDTTVTEIDLPERSAQSAIRRHVGTTGAIEQGLYHRRALLHVHGDGPGAGLAQNLTAWTLASVWRGVALYPLYGRVIVTGRDPDGRTTALEDDLLRQTHTVAQTVRETLREWRTRPPVSNDAALTELLAYAASDVASCR